MDKLRIAVAGYGNTGKAAVEAVLAAPDMELAGVVRRDAAPAPELYFTKIVSDIGELGKIDAALLCSPTRSFRDYALKFLKLGINTVDSYDDHTSVYEYMTELDSAAKRNGAVAVVAAGWDPGGDSVVRALFGAMAPRGITHTNFGPGMSLGHTAVAKAVEGVADAMSVTVPKGEGLHRRMVYVKPKDGFCRDTIEKKIKEDPSFSHDETYVIITDDVRALADRGHAVSIVRKGVSGETDNQLFELRMKMSGPALTGQILAACARAAAKREPGAYTMIELPVIDLLPGNREDLIRKLV